MLWLPTSQTVLCFGTFGAFVTGNAFVGLMMVRYGYAVHDIAWFIAGVFASATLPITMFGIRSHLADYRAPHLQRRAPLAGC